jgi:hypothetical protein
MTCGKSQLYFDRFEISAKIRPKTGNVSAINLVKATGIVVTA